MFLLLIPFIFLVLSFILKSAMGPFWQFPDPSYGYLTSSLSLFRGFSPTFNDHPGTTVQMIGAIVIYLGNIGRGMPEAVKQVLLNPDFPLNIINITLLILIFLSSIYIGFYIWRKTHDQTACALSQVIVLSFLTLRSYSFYDYLPPVVSIVSPEPLLISVGILFNIFVLKLYFTNSEKDELNTVLVLGIISAAGIVTRITFAPLLLLPLVVCRGWNKLLYLFVTLAACFLFSIPILPSYPWIFKWIFKLSTHVGGYGSGAEGIIHLGQFLDNLHKIIGKLGLLFYTMPAILFYSLFQVIKKKDVRANVFLLSTLVCVALEMTVVCKNYDEHYLVPAVNLFTLLFVFTYLNVKPKPGFFRSTVFTCVLVFVFYCALSALSYAKQLSSYTRDALDFNKKIHARYPGSVFIGVFPMPMVTPDSSLFWGNDRDCQNHKELAGLYPDSLVYFSNNVNNYGPYITGIYSIEHRVWADDLLASGAHVIFVAPKDYDFSHSPYTVFPLESAKYAQAYLLVQSTEKEADYLFNMAGQFLAQGDLHRACAFALKSNELHYQPDGKFYYMVKFIQDHLHP